MTSKGTVRSREQDMRMMVGMCFVVAGLLSGGCDGAGPGGNEVPEDESGDGGIVGEESGESTDESGVDVVDADADAACEGVNCDDGNPCTDDLCDDGECAHPPRTNAACDDGNACTLDDFCNSGGLCAGGGSVPCDDGNPCTETSCDVVLGCQSSLLANGAPCDDGDACTVGDVCGELGCGGEALECPPSVDACETPVACDSVTGECTYGPKLDGESCDDGDWCTTEDSCTGGQCAGTELVDCMYLDPPIPGTCYEGVLGEEQKLRALLYLNELRAIHGIPPVVYDSSGDILAQRAAFMMSVNSDISHYPSENWACHSVEGAQGCQESNLSIQWSSGSGSLDGPEEEIDGWLIDKNVPSLGHRRWLVDPFLQKIAYGSAHGAPLVAASWPWSQASTIHVIHEAQNDPSEMTQDFVAYPQGEYPANAFAVEEYLSFSALVSKTSKWANSDVSFAEATIQVQGPDGGSLSLNSISWNNDGYGLPNNLQWRVEGLQTGLLYTVTVSGVGTPSGAKSYSYGFRLN